MSTIRVERGPFSRNEIPEAIPFYWRMPDGVPLNLSGYTASVYIEKPDGTKILPPRAAEIVDAPAGYTRYKFQAGDLDQSDTGTTSTKIQMVVENPDVRLASVIAVLIVGDAPSSS